MFGALFSFSGILTMAFDNRLASDWRRGRYESSRNVSFFFTSSRQDVTSTDGPSIQLAHAAAP